jgi:anti-sigma B factor antagonist
VDATDLPPTVLTTTAGRDDDVVLITVIGDADASRAPELQQAVDRGARASHHLVVDLSGVNLVDSAALGVLLRVAKRLRPRGGDVRIVAGSEPIRRLFEITLLDRLFPLHVSVDEAIAAFDAEDAPAPRSAAARR